MTKKDQILLETLYKDILLEQEFLAEGLTDSVANWVWSLVEKKFPKLVEAVGNGIREIIKTKNIDQAANIIVQAFQQAPPEQTNEGLGNLINTGLNAATPYLQSAAGLVHSIKDLPKLMNPYTFSNAILKLVPDIIESLMTFVHSIGSGNIEDIHDLVTEPTQTILKKVGIVVALALLAYGAKKYASIKGTA